MAAATNNKKRAKILQFEKTSLLEVKDKGGRVDCLLMGAFQLLSPFLDQKVKLPGLASALSPIVEDEIRKHVSKECVIPSKYNDLATVLAQAIAKGMVATPPPMAPVSNENKDVKDEEADN